MRQTSYSFTHFVRYFIPLFFALLALLFTMVFLDDALAAPGDISFYGSDGYITRDILEINASAGTTNVVGTLPVSNRAIAQDPTTTLIYYYEWLTVGDQFGYLDPATGNTTVVRNYSPAPGFYAVRMAFAPDGTLYMMDTTNQLYEIDQGNGNFNLLGTVTGIIVNPLSGNGDMAFAPDGTLYVVSHENLYTVDTSLLMATVIATEMLDITNQGITFWTGLAYCDDSLYASHIEQFTALSAIYEIDPESGSTTQLFYTTATIADLTSCSGTVAPPTNTPLPSATNTPQPTATSTPLPTATGTPLPTATNTPQPTATDTPLPTATNTPLPTATNTPLPTATNTPLPTATNTPLPTATNTPTPTATNTPTPAATNTPLPTATNTPQPTATNIPTPAATNTPLPTATNTPTPTATNTPTPAATNTPTPTATNTPTPAATNTPTPAATNTPTPAATNTPTPAANPLLLYGSNSYGLQELVEFNIDSNSYSVIGAIGLPTQAMGLDPATGRVYYYEWRTSGDELGYWDPLTGLNNIVRTYTPAPGIYAKRMTFAPDGTLYMMGSFEDLYIIDKNSGDLTFLGYVTGMIGGFLGGTGDMAFAPDGTLYINTYENLYSVNLFTLEATLIAADMLDLNQAGLTLWTGLGYCDGYLYGSSAEQSLGVSGLYRIDPADGSVTFVLYTNLIINDLTSCPPL